MANEFCHIELSTDDTGKAEAFYKKVFDWKLSPSKGMPYTMINTGSKQVGGGIQGKQMAEQPTAWLPYVTVKDVKKHLEKAEKAGARVVQPYMELPGTGAIGIFVDPQGAAMGLWQPAKKVAKKAPAAKKKKKR